MAVMAAKGLIHLDFLAFLPSESFRANNLYTELLLICSFCSLFVIHMDQLPDNIDLEVRKSDMDVFQT